MKVYFLKESKKKIQTLKSTNQHRMSYTNLVFVKDDVSQISKECGKNESQSVKCFWGYGFIGPSFYISLL